jgi:hypothetical protein
VTKDPDTLFGFADISIFATLRGLNLQVATMCSNWRRIREFKGSHDVADAGCRGTQRHRHAHTHSNSQPLRVVTCSNKCRTSAGTPSATSAWWLFVDTGWPIKHGRGTCAHLPVPMQPRCMF